MKFKSNLGVFLLLIAIPLIGSIEFKRVEQWNHGEMPSCGLIDAVIDKDNRIIAGFYRVGNYIITANKIVKFAPYGEGPGDLMDFRAIFNYKGDIAIVERCDKIKIFRKKGETYGWKKTFWMKRGRFPHIVMGAVFLNNMWILTGFEYLNINRKNGHREVSCLKVYNENGKPLKRLIEKKFTKATRLHEMKYHIANYKDKLFFLPEDSLNLKVISKMNFNVQKVVNLESPEFYKKMPDDFYIFKFYNSPKDFVKDLEKWKTSYSRITKVAAVENYIVLQIRTCEDKLKKFALLFYNISNNYVLEKTIFIDDFFLGAKNGKFYFFANGNPGIDENTDNCIINIYQIGG